MTIPLPDAYLCVNCDPEQIVTGVHQGKVTSCPACGSEALLSIQQLLAERPRPGSLGAQGPLILRGRRPAHAQTIREVLEGRDYVNMPDPRPYPPPIQPDWLKALTYGLEAGNRVRVVAESPRFAIVKYPGRKYRSGQETRYGAVTWAITPKSPAHPKNDGCDLMRIELELKTGGRATIDDLAKWKKMLDRAEDGHGFDLPAGVNVTRG
jgi:hypothetical protein